MKEETRKPLVVYKASAGAGKTFRLALEYIKLLINDPGSYRHILAVTFTNKATEEMKNRILTQLYGISRNLEDSDTKSYVELIKKECGHEEALIRRNAGIALNNLLHNYSYFRVETIDSFFQSVLRNLARELELSANLRLELNDKQIGEQAVDEMIESLSTTSAELKWILDYIRSNIDDDKGWNVIDQIKSFGENIFKDIYKQDRKQLTETLHQKDFFETYVGQLRKIRQQAAEKMKSYGETFFRRVTERGLSEKSFTGGLKGVPGYFLKLQNGNFSDKQLLTKTIQEALTDPNKWLKKADQKESSPVYQAVNEEFQSLLQESEQTRKKNFLLYMSADLTLRHMNQLRLLNSIDSFVHESNKATNRFLLSDTQVLLNSLISDSDSPFIFEKIGSQLQHIMIDEFQDTSSIQWKNFMVLLKNCMSQTDSHNLIVGDVKQSIYRWRAGDWQLLSNIEREFTPDELYSTDLSYNRRSATRIIKFNNAFFDKAVSAESNAISEENAEGAEQIRQAYKYVEQIIPEEKADVDNGYVSIDLLPKTNYKEETMLAVKTQIEALLEAGAEAADIAILLRSNPNIQAIADYLMRELPEVKLVSDEAFRLDASPAVNVIVEAMRSLANPKDNICKAFLAKNYQQHILGRDVAVSEIFDDIEQLDQFLPHEFTRDPEGLRSLPVYDLAERLYTIFNLSALPSQSAYICTFYDQLRKFLADGLPDLNLFLDAWKETICSKTIQNDGAEGIRLLTIHKSKGLEFKHVILPFCDWKLERTNLIWCKPDEKEKPFNKLPLIPIDFSAGSMRGTVFESDYLEEHLQNTVDNMNLLYVAFTRAVSSLHVIGRTEATGTRSATIELVLGEVQQALSDSALTETDEGHLHFEYGCLTIEKEEKKSSKNIFRQKSEAIDVDASSKEAHLEFRQSNASRNFVSNDEDDDKQKSYIELGMVMHEIFSTIRTRADIPAALARLEAGGVIYDGLITKQRLLEMLHKRLEDPRVADWFSSRWQLFNECTILTINPETGEVKEKRPDRVMTDGRQTIVVDFKFGKPNEDYRGQVMDYMGYLKDMGYQNVKGYLWYVYSNKIQEV